MKTGVAMCAMYTLLCGHAYSNEQVLTQGDTIVFLGDSITALGVQPDGYVTLSSQAISAAYPDKNIRIIGAGIGGHKVSNCQERLDRDVLQKNPTVVVIYIGLNDVWHWSHPRVVAPGKKGTTPEDFESGLKDMIGKINDVGARVILCPPTVIGEKHDGSNPEDGMLDDYAAISRKVAGGSYLLNCGPMGNGKIDPKAGELFSGIGDWICDNHESIYDTEANPLPSRPEWGDASLSKDGKTLYLHVMKWPGHGTLRVDGVPVTAASATFLAPGGANQNISLSQDGATLALDLPAKAIDEHNSVVKVRFLSRLFRFARSGSRRVLKSPSRPATRA